MAEEVLLLVLAGKRDASEAKMRSEVWSRLPASVMENVLIWLGKEDQVRLAAVCKEWRSLFLSAWFREKQAVLGFSSCNPVWIIDHLGHRYAGDEAQPQSIRSEPDQGSLRKVRVDLGFLPSKYRHIGCGRRPRAGCGVVYIGGGGGSSICIANLANGTCRELPPVPVLVSGYHVSVEGVAPDDHGSSTYRVWSLVRDFRINQAYLVVCSSTNWVWTKVVTPGKNVYSSFVICKGLSYMTTNNFLECYDVVNGRLLRHLRLPNCNRGMIDFLSDFLSSFDDRVFYTAKNGDDLISIWECIWDDSGISWLQVSGICLDMLVTGDVLLAMHVQAVAETLYIALSLEHGSWYLFAYSILQDSWLFILKSVGDSQQPPFIVGEWLPSLRL